MQVVVSFDLREEAPNVQKHIGSLLTKLGRSFAKGDVKDGYTAELPGVTMKVAVTMTELPPPIVSKVLCLFLLKELENEQNGGDSPTTLGTAKDSLSQMGDRTIAELVGDDFNYRPSYDGMRSELDQLVQKYGYNYRADLLDLEV
jgi:hypothetical protein